MRLNVQLLKIFKKYLSELMAEGFPLLPDCPTPFVKQYRKAVLEREGPLR